MFFLCVFFACVTLEQALQQTAALKSPPTAQDHKVAAKAEQKVAATVEVKTTPVMGTDQPAEARADGSGSALPKCIGPGCQSDAQPDSVYCGNVCILKHAEAAMKSITDVKEPAEKATGQRRPAAKSTAKVTREHHGHSASFFLPGSVGSSVIRLIPRAHGDLWWRQDVWPQNLILVVLGVSGVVLRLVHKRIWTSPFPESP